MKVGFLSFEENKIYESLCLIPGKRNLQLIFSSTDAEITQLQLPKLSKNKTQRLALKKTREKIPTLASRTYTQTWVMHDDAIEQNILCSFLPRALIDETAINVLKHGHTIQGIHIDSIAVLQALKPQVNPNTLILHLSEETLALFCIGRHSVHARHIQINNDSSITSRIEQEITRTCAYHHFSADLTYHNISEDIITPREQRRYNDTQCIQEGEFLPQADIPASIRASQALGGYKKTILTSSILLLISLLPIGFLASKQNNTLQQHVQYLGEVFDEIKITNNAIQENLTEIYKTEQEIGRYEELHTRQNYWALFFQEIQDIISLTQNTWIDSFRPEKQGINNYTLSGKIFLRETPKRPDSPINKEHNKLLEGLINRLKQLPQINEIKTITFTSNKPHIIEFQIKINLVKT